MYTFTWIFILMFMNVFLWLNKMIDYILLVFMLFVTLFILYGKIQSDSNEIFCWQIVGDAMLFAFPVLLCKNKVYVN